MDTVLDTVDPHRLDCDWLGHRNEILEEAAKVCDEFKVRAESGSRGLSQSWMAADCAKAIRALKRE